jgi:hypothetical protein
MLIRGCIFVEMFTMLIMARRSRHHAILSPTENGSKIPDSVSSGAQG